MKIVQSSKEKTSKKQKYIYCLIYPDDSVRFADLSDYYENRPEQKAERIREYLTHQAYIKDGLHPVRFDQFTNVVCSASLRANKNATVYKGWHKFEDLDDPSNRVVISSSCVQELIGFITDGNLKVKNGYLEGLWTIKTVGGSQSLTPYASKSLSSKLDLDPDDEDLSDFVSKM